MKELWLRGKEMSVYELSEVTNMSKQKIRTAVISLRDRQLIKTRREDKKIGYGSPPGKILITINEKRERKIREIMEKNK